MPGTRKMDPEQLTAAGEKLYLVSSSCRKSCQNHPLHRHLPDDGCVPGALAGLPQNRSPFPDGAGGSLSPPRPAALQVWCSGWQEVGSIRENRGLRAAVTPRWEALGCGYPSPWHRNSVAGVAAAAAAAIRTLEHGSRATQGFPVCKGAVNEKRVNFLLSVHFLGMNQMDFCS